MQKPHLYRFLRVDTTLVADIRTFFRKEKGPFSLGKNWEDDMLKVAIYGKGGIGKSTVTSNLAAAFATMGKRVIQIGCDPKADSTINLLEGKPLRPVMNYMREEDEEPEKLEDISKEGFGGVLCIETGRPDAGTGMCWQRYYRNIPASGRFETF